MLRKISLLILFCSLFSVFACGNMNSALKEGDGDTDEVTKIGTPVEPLPTTDVKAQVTKYISEHSKWENASEDVYLEFNSKDATAKIFSSTDLDGQKIGYEVSDDGSIVTTDDKYLLSLSEDLKDLIVTDTENERSIKMFSVEAFKICMQEQNHGCIIDTLGKTAEAARLTALDGGALRFGSSRFKWDLLNDTRSGVKVDAGIVNSVLIK